MSGVRITTLGDGLRVATDAMDSVETASVGVWVDVGARHEAAEINGVSHLLEHMAFKGTERRDARAIAEEIEAVGGHLNAYTTRETTAFYAKVLKDDLALAVDIIADIVQHSAIDPGELARERTVVLQEINQANDTPDDVVFDRFQEVAFPGQALGRPVLGSAERVRDMARDAIIGFYASHYRPSRLVLAASGRIDHDHLVGLAEAAFRARPNAASDAPEPARYVGGEVREDKDLEQVQIVIGFPGIAHSDDDYYAASVFSTLFGGGLSSRLFQEVREKRGLVYSIYSYLSCYADGGIFGIHAGTGEKEIAEVIPLVCDEFQKVCRAVGEDEVGRARAQLKASTLMALESTSTRAEQLAGQLHVFGRPLGVGEIIGRIEGVDAAAVVRVANRLRAGTPTVAAIGPIARLEPYEAIVRRLA